MVIETFIIISAVSYYHFFEPQCINKNTDYAIPHCFSYINNSVYIILIYIFFNVHYIDITTKLDITVMIENFSSTTYK